MEWKQHDDPVAVWFWWATAGCLSFLVGAVFFPLVHLFFGAPPENGMAWALGALFICWGIGIAKSSGIMAALEAAAGETDDYPPLNRPVRGEWMTIEVDSRNWTGYGGREGE